MASQGGDSRDSSIRRMKIEQDADHKVSDEPLSTEKSSTSAEQHMDSASENTAKPQKLARDELPKQMHQMKIKENKPDNSNKKVIFGVKFL